MNNLSLISRRVVLKYGAAGAAWLLTGCAERRTGERGEAGATGAAMRTLQENPYNAEPAAESLVGAWITPAEQFYVRSHGPVPEVDVGAYRLKVSGMVNRPLAPSLEQLKREYPAQRITATLTCAGNRRAEHSKVRALGGVQWTIGAIGNAEWTGVPLAAVLERAGVSGGAKFVWFNSVDRVKQPGGEISFGASIPMDKAVMRGAGGPLLAYEMNGARLPAQHGYPLRVVVPGLIGARSVKWLGEIVVSERDTENYFVARDYKLIPEDTDAAWAAGTPLMETNLNSAICVPADGQTIRSGRVRVAGYALAPGNAGRTIRRVEISMDDGATWREAQVTSPVREYCWALWQADVELESGAKKLVVRATDSEGETQPRTVAWNAKGYMFNAWHGVGLAVD